ncbi:MAG: metal ABC transporter permease [Candidatus Sungiibacteriota bacterium]
MTALLSLFQYGFAVRALEAGIIVALAAPLIGIFLVLRRYSLIADTFAHISLAGLAMGFLLGWNPMLTALGATLVASLGIERLRISKKVYGESALAIFLSGGLALAVVLVSAGKGMNPSILNYLFGSIVTVTSRDVAIIALLAGVVAGALLLFYKELVYTTFDEESAAVSGINTGLVNTILILLAAFTVSLAIPIVGVLLISALMIIPVACALQFKKSFMQTVLYAEAISLGSMIAGIMVSFAYDISTGGAIVLIMIAFFILILGYKRFSYAL